MTSGGKRRVASSGAARSAPSRIGAIVSASLAANSRLPTAPRATSSAPRIGTPDARSVPSVRANRASAARRETPQVAVA